MIVLLRFNASSLVSANIQSSNEIHVSLDPFYIHIFSGGITNYWILNTDWKLEDAQNKLFNILGQLKIL